MDGIEKIIDRISSDAQREIDDVLAAAQAEAEKITAKYQAQAKAEAVELAVAAGAVRETVEIIEAEDVPLAYYPGNTNRVKIKAAGDLCTA